MKEFEDLKQLLNEEDTHFNKTIEKKMDKKISKKVGKYLLCFLLIISFIVSGLHFITKAVKFNPTKTNVKFEYILQSYIWLYHPDVIYHPYLEEGAQEKLFGKYEYKAEFDERFHYRIIGDNPLNYSIQGKNIDLSALTEISPIVVNKFDKKYKESYEENPSSKQEIIQELKKLPDSTYIDATVVFSNNKTIEEVVEFMKLYSNTDFIWLAMESYDEIQGFVTGVNLQECIGYGVELENYENLFGINEMPTHEEIINKYYDMLEILIDNPIAYEMFIEKDMNRSYEHLKQQYDYAQNHLNSIGVRIYTNKKDLIEMIEKNECFKVWIEDMKLSKLAK